MNKFEEYVKLTNEAYRLAQTITVADVEQAWREWLEANPRFFGVAWKQGTPSFNDGDPCTFRLHETYYITQDGLKQEAEDNGVDMALLEQDELSFLKKLNIGYARQLYLFAEACEWGGVASTPPNIHRNILERLFGDSYIVITRKCSFTEEYEPY
ncbi:MAG: hypothetical protein E6R04_11480 [Spirochaetes bacterium]|nr:MAG: hypothetical protein E6R04_11480 [Spirochaetota bacterium]